jgi:heme-degrading monooxygenase HmoA
MFARIVEFIPRLEKKEEFVKVVRNEVLPILKKQPGFLEILPFFPETKAEKVMTITLWTENGRQNGMSAKCTRRWKKF